MMSLGRPTRGLTLAQLEAEIGKGDSLTCFAQHAIFYWYENIPMPNKANRQERRDAIWLLANNSYLHPLTVLAVIFLKKREARVEEQIRSLLIKMKVRS